MKSLCLLIVTAFALVVCHDARGHGVPIVLSVPSGSNQLATSFRIYESDFELLLGVLSTDVPGFAVDSAADGVPTDAVLAAQVAGKLWRHDGAGLVDAQAQLVIENFVADSITVDKDTIVLPSLDYGTYDGQPGWHQDVLYTLEPSSAPAGAYGLALRVVSSNHPELTASEPLVIVFNHQLSEEVFAEGVQAIAAQVLKIPGDVNFDGMVDIFDVNLVSANWSTTGPVGDANGDQTVDIFDVNLISSQWGENVLDLGAGGATPVPEPATALLLAFGAALLVVIVSRRVGPDCVSASVDRASRPEGVRNLWPSTRAPLDRPKTAKGS